MSSIVNNRFPFQLIFITILTLFVFHISNDLDLDLDSQYFLNINAVEIAHYNDEKEIIDLNYLFDSSEYYEEDNVPQNNNNNINNYNNRNNQLTQQQSEEKQVYNQIKKIKKVEKTSNNSNNSNNNKDKKYEFTSIESKNNKNYDIKSDYITFKTVLNLQNIEKTGFIRLVGYINGQSFKEDIQLSKLAPSTVNKFDVKLKVLKDIGFVSLDPPDEFVVCAYHLKDLEKEYNSILNYDCNEVDVQSSDGTNTVRLFKPSSMKYSESKALYDEQQQKGQGQDSKEDDKVLLKIISPLGDRKNTKELKFGVSIRGQIQTEMIKDVQEELAKSNDDTITRTFTFDRKTDLGNIQIGDLFSACVSSNDLNPPEGQECEKRLVKKFNSANSLPAR